MKRITFTILTAIMAVFSSQAATTVFDCDIEATSVKAYTATLQFTPTDNNVYYICGISTKTQFESLGEAYITNYYKETMDASIEEGSAEGYDDFGHTGSYELTSSKLNPESQYVAFAYTYSTLTGKATSAMTTYEFSTPKDIPAETDVYLNIVNTHWVDKVASNGWWQITGWTEDYDYYVQFCADPVTTTEGTYTLTNTSWDWNYTGVYYYVSAGSYPVKRNATDMTVTVTVDEDGVYNFTAEYLDDRGVTYHITFDPYDPGAVVGESYDMTEDVETTFAQEEGRIKYNETEGSFNVVYEKANGEFFDATLYSTGDELVDGEYTINSSLDDMTAESAAYDEDSYNITGTVYGTLDEEGYTNTPWYWCMSGTITVSHDAEGNLQLEVNAKNTWNKKAHITVKGEDTAIREFESSNGSNGSNGLNGSNGSRKYIENGRILIKKGGVKYTLSGVRIK